MRPAPLLCATLTLAAQSPAERAVAAVLADWHLTAAQADEVPSCLRGLRGEFFHPNPCAGARHVLSGVFAVDFYQLFIVVHRWLMGFALIPFIPFIPVPIY